MSAAVSLEPVFLNVGEVATILRTTPTAVYKLVERGQVAGVVRIGRRVLVRRDVLLASLDWASDPPSGRSRL